MTENSGNYASSKKCQQPRGKYQPGGIDHQIMEDPVRFNFLSRDAATSTVGFVARLLCKCGSLAEVWSERSEAFVWCLECGDYRTISLEGIEDIETEIVNRQ
ncbi:MAG TPA: hypothetical protein VF343_05020 [Syntrophales bacterium]